MTLLVDYVHPPGGATIKAAGYSGAARYLSTDPTKNLTPAERDDLHANGLSIVLVWETTATRASAGFAAGARDARTAEAQAEAIGYPAGCPIFYAVDFDAADPTVVKAYFDGVRSVATRPVGIYGSLRVVDTALAGGWAAYGWQSCAWSGTTVSQRAHLYQRLKPTVVHPLANTDEDVVLRAFPMWTPAAAPSVPAAPASAVPVVFQKPNPVAKVIQKVVQKVTRATLVVDGVFGPATIRQWQKVMGTPQDGVISDPSSLIRAVQRRLGHLVVDGIPGRETWRAIQRHLCVPDDGVPGPLTIKALQRRLNANQF